MVSALGIYFMKQNFHPWKPFEVLSFHLFICQLEELVFQRLRKLLSNGQTFRDCGPLSLTVVGWGFAVAVARGCPWAIRQLSVLPLMDRLKKVNVGFPAIFWVGKRCLRCPWGLGKSGSHTWHLGESPLYSWNKLPSQEMLQKPWVAAKQWKIDSQLRTLPQPLLSHEPAHPCFLQEVSGCHSYRSALECWHLKTVQLFCFNLAFSSSMSKLINACLLTGKWNWIILLL